MRTVNLNISQYKKTIIPFIKIIVFHIFLKFCEDKKNDIQHIITVVRLQIHQKVMNQHQAKIAKT